MKQFDNEAIDSSMSELEYQILDKSMDLSRSRKPTYIKEQNNYNCQQFFGNISGSTFVMPTPQAQSAKPPKQAEENNVKYVQRGPRKQSLFTSNKPSEENKKASNEEKQRFMRYLNDHKMSSRKLTCKKDDTLNDVVTCFVIKWQDKGLTAKSPSGGAIFRFLTDECKLQSDVTEQSYSNEIKERLRKENYTVETMKKVNSVF